jgi:hypothetical protein
MKRSKLPVITIFFLGFLALGVLISDELDLSLSINGRVCNHSSLPVWLTLTESSQKKAYLLPPGQCTHFFNQDAEAVWGKDCKTSPCQYQAWKVSAGRFDLQNGQSSSVLRIKGWGALSRWHISGDWPRPDLAWMDYSLVR